MPDDYTKLVIDSYKQKRAANALSPRLINPTPAKIRAECEARLSAGINWKDQRTLDTFFEKDGNEQVDLKTIKRFDRDKFKPLANYLNGETADTNLKNIELLAWLIDLEQRPYEYGKRYDVDNISSIDVATEESQEYSDKEGLTSQQPFAGVQKQSEKVAIFRTDPHSKHRYAKTKAAIIVIIILILAGAVAYWPQKNKPEPLSLVNFKSGEACMYWVGDHYEQTSCTQKHGDTLVVALDTLELRYLRKINTPDTITLNAIGRVWYIQTNKQIECFTSAGNYPIDPKRRLRPITKLIIQKHIHPGN